MRRGKTYYIGVIGFVLLVAVFHYTAALASKDAVPVYVMDIIMQNRLMTGFAQKELIDEFEKYLYPYDSFVEEVEEQIEIRSDGAGPIWLTRSEALADVDQLFRLLKFGYCGYQYFGGDGRFSKAEAAIEEKLASGSDRILTASFSRLLIDNLDFIQDGHFLIGYQVLQKRLNCYMDESLPFLKDEHGFYTLIDNDKSYLLEVNGGAPEEYLKLSLNDEGEIVFYLGKMDFQESLWLAIDIKLQIDGGIIMKNIILDLMPSLPDFNWDKLYTYGEIAGIPIVELRSFTPSSEREVRELYNFTEEAQKIREENILLLDLRGNFGGYTFYGQRWLENYTDEIIYPNLLMCKLITKTTQYYYWYEDFEGETFLKVDELNKELYGDVPSYIYAEYDTMEYFPGWGPVIYYQPQRVKNEKLIFVIIDRFGASATEYFINLLSQVENVIFIGENSAGTQLTDHGSYILPNSRLRLNFGSTLCLNYDLQSREGSGYQPDFWVPPHLAVERIIKFLGKYDVESLQKQ